MPNTYINSGINLNTAGTKLDSLLEKEWLLSNTRGGFASSTVIACNTRRYHGILTGSLEPPANRIMTLSSCFETIDTGQRTYNLGVFEFPGKILDEGLSYLKSFSKDIGVHYNYEIGNIELRKSVYLMHDKDTAAIVYEFKDVPKEFDFSIRPLAALRDFHSLQNSKAVIKFEKRTECIVIHHDSPDSYKLLLSCPDIAFEPDPQWWYNFLYRAEKERGQDFTEDLFSPGYFKCSIDSPARIVLLASLRNDFKPDNFYLHDIDGVIRQLYEHQMEITASAKKDEILKSLYIAADQFIANRQINANISTTILAGFPWFADWGRDTFISLPGLLLAPKRFGEVKSVLATFARAISNGMIPNRFDDYTNTAHFNSVDASLWFVNAAFEYLKASNDDETFKKDFLPAIISIINSYQHGTFYGIHADHDGLITAGDSETQLTWMDAKYQNTVFTPRFGKAVEVNALWYNALMLLSEYLENNDINDKQLLNTMRARAGIVKQSFCKSFWNKTWGWLNDCIFPDGTADASLRPNQIFAVSLPFSPLPLSQQKAVVSIVRDKLLTPLGLRTLSPDDTRYKPQYSGALLQRDAAYHQGTVWPYLIGPFVEAYLKVNGLSAKTKKAARKFIQPLLANLTEDGCIGSICEIFDGENPQKSKGCFAQAWSVAQLIKAYLLTKTGRL